MDLDAFIAAMLRQNRLVVRPTDPQPDRGWYVVATESEYIDGGFSLRVTDRHPVITGAVKYALEQIGFEVQLAHGDDRLEAWPAKRANNSAPKI